MEDTLHFLGNIWPKKINSDLVEGYFNALQGYSNEDIVEAAAKYAEDDNDYFPTPGKLKKCIPVKNYDGTDNSKFHLTEYKMECQASGCFKKDLCIREPNEKGIPYICRDCYTGLTFSERNQRLRDIMHMIKDKNFKPEWVSRP